MVTSKFTRRLFWAAEAALLAGTVAAAALISSTQEWQPAALVVLVLLLALLGQWLSVETSDGELSASLVAIVLAMGLLGPGPAAACGVAAMILKSAVRRLAPAQWLNNLATFAVVPFLGALIIRAVTHNVHGLSSHHLTPSVVFGLIVFGAFSCGSG